MNANVRERVRQAVDRAARERIRQERRARPLSTCSECSAGIEEQTPGCERCRRRARARERREEERRQLLVALAQLLDPEPNGQWRRRGV